MRSEFLQVLDIQILLATKKHSSMSHPIHFGIPFLMIISIIMEYADNGDLF